jgi:hypothetical protein
VCRRLKPARDDEQKELFGTAEQPAEKLIWVGETADPSPVKGFGMTKSKRLVGTTEVVP